MYALYAWGNALHESELDRDPGWLAPEVLSGERQVVSDYLCLTDEGPLRVDGPNTIFDVEDEQVEGRALVGRDLAGARWRVVWIRVATDGTLEEALRVGREFADAGDVFVDESPERNPLGFGEVVTIWEDEHGQWDLTLVRV
ncbi:MULTISPECIES: hypothetical protein [Actinosynnema]|uniref:hypothetical protein n=1 Tax=Actinosynnema TaxID=40566 RepID=UPI0020A57FCB|nr:hypothetical protein [Actinosynnema pretiosum]MCP2094421.1 hypothetical protein [Actinosynnema pretiosum]